MPFILFILLLLGIDLIAFQVVQAALSKTPTSVYTSVTFLFWSIPVAFIAWLIWNNTQKGKKRNGGNYRLTRSIFFLIYFAKFLLILLYYGLQLLRIIWNGIASFFSGGLISSGSNALLAWGSIVLVSIPFLLLVMGIFRNRHRYKVHRIKVPIDGLPTSLDGLKIVQLSDIHSGSFTAKEPLKKGIELINKEAADLVFFTGDLVNSVATEIEPYQAVFEKIEAKYGVFSILGNHDYGDYVRWESPEHKLTNLKRLFHAHKQMGWQLLLNENRLLTINGESVAVIGVENYSASPRFPKLGDIFKAYKGSESATLKLLLSHDPSHWRAQIVAQFPDIAVTFSGHTHGAQFGMEIPGWIKWSPVKYVYKEWAGLYQEGKQYLYVNRGFGYLAYPGRVGILPEITAMTLCTV